MEYWIDVLNLFFGSLNTRFDYIRISSPHGHSVAIRSNLKRVGHTFGGFMGRAQHLLGCMNPSESTELLLGVVEIVECSVAEFADSNVASGEVTDSIVQAVSLLLNDAKVALVHEDRECTCEELNFGGNVLALLLSSFSRVLLSCVAAGPVTQPIVDLVEVLRDCSGTVEGVIGSFQTRTLDSVEPPDEVGTAPLKTYSISEFLGLDPLEQAIILSGGASSMQPDRDEHVAGAESAESYGFSSIYFQGDGQLLACALKCEYGVRDRQSSIDTEDEEEHDLTSAM